MPQYDPKEFQALSFHDAVPRFLDGSDTPRAYLERCLETIDRREPTVRAFVAMNVAGSRKAADAATARYRENRPLSPLDGMPIGVKDLFETADMPTEMGSPIFKGWQGKRDSAAVYALRQTGIVILGKLVTTEFGFYHPGPTTNPFDAQRTPGGSSSGSAAAVGAKMVPVAIGSQVVGSLVRPASYCANYGHKPTLGALNKNGGHSSLSQSCLGIHAGNLRDMWETSHHIAAVAGGDAGYPGLAGPREIGGPAKPARLVRLDTVGWDGATAEAREALETAIRRIRAEGVEVASRHDSPEIAEFEQLLSGARDITHAICGYELRWPLKAYRDMGANALSADLLKRLESWEHLTPDEYRTALGRREDLRRRSAALLEKAEGYITLSANGPAPASLGNTGDPVFAVPASLLGAPALSLPLLATERMPLGLQIIGPVHGDHALVRLAAWLEKVLL
jgi:Asp-tRNA(Asn)/Glu-tRNA(Gln) amidotransferase A subunit family amidase